MKRILTNRLPSINNKKNFNYNYLFSGLINFFSTTNINESQNFKFSDLKINLSKKKCEIPDPSTLIFGHTFSSHMLSIPWKQDGGWGKPRIHPLENFSLHPAAKVLHYANELFEGSKAYRGVDGKIRLFRPDMNLKRMNKSATRAALPNFSEEDLLKLIKKLVEIDEDWVPHSTTSSLYIRPTIIGIEPSLGVSKPLEALLYVITGPVGPYFKTGFSPVSLLADPKHVRAWEGGCGSYKMGSNYAPTVKIQEEAIEKGCQQVLWLYGPNHLVTEVGTMNLFINWINKYGESELITPSLDNGLILPGVVRQSILDLTIQQNNIKVTERDVFMEEIIEALKENRIKEMFGSGTACVVCPISSILFGGKKMEIPTNTTDEALSIQCYNKLHDIQYGKIKHPWGVTIN